MRSKYVFGCCWLEKRRAAEADEENLAAWQGWVQGLRGAQQLVFALICRGQGL